MEAWRQWPTRREEQRCFTQQNKNRLDSDRPSHGRPFHSLTPIASLPSLPSRPASPFVSYLSCPSRERAGPRPKVKPSSVVGGCRNFHVAYSYPQDGFDPLLLTP